MDGIDQDTRDKIIETHTDVKHLMSASDAAHNRIDVSNQRITCLEKRISRVENLFLPGMTQGTKETMMFGPRNIQPTELRRVLILR